MWRKERWDEKILVESMMITELTAELNASWRYDLIPLGPALIG
jgi:hypothetical protein